MNQSHAFDRSQLDVQQIADDYLDWTTTATVPRQVDGLTVNKELRRHGVDVAEPSPEGLVARKDTFVDAAQLCAVMA
jgi:hypothetical protein